MSIYNLSYHNKAITGGHKYNDLFCSYLKEISKEEVVNIPIRSSVYHSWRKLYAPFAELMMLRKIHNGDIVFLNDTSHNYHLLLAFFIGLRRKISSVVIIHHFHFLNYKGIWRLLTFLIQYLYYFFCRYIVVPSPYTYDLAKRLYPYKDIRYIPIPFKKVFVPSSEYEIGRLLYVGTIEERKGLLYLIESLGLIRKKKPDLNLKLDIVGKIIDNQYYNEILQRTEELDVKSMLNFRGRVSDQDLDRLYNKAELFVFPSMLEGYGMVLIEAMNRGIPVVVFNNSAMPYLISDGVNGMMAENKNACSFAEKIMMLTGNIELRCRIQKGIQATINHLATKEDFEKGIKSFYQAKLNV